MIRAWVLAVALAGVSAAATARADDTVVGPDAAGTPEPPAAIARPNVVRDSIELHSAFWFSERFGTAWPLVLSGQHRLAALPVGTVMGALALPFGAQERGQNKSGGGFAAGNPTATLTYALTTRGITPFLGVRIGAPIASAGSETSDVVLERAAAAMGYYDHHLWSVGYLPLAAPFGVEIQSARVFWLRGTFTPQLHAAIEQWAETRGSMQGELAVEGRAVRGAGGGVALRAVANGVFRSAADRPDDTQASLEPYFVYDGALLVRAGIMIALDTPLGFGEDNDMPVVAPQLTLGARIDEIVSRQRARTASR